MVLTVRYICKGHREAFAKTIEGIEKEKRKKKKKERKRKIKIKIKNPLSLLLLWASEACLGFIINHEVDV